MLAIEKRGRAATRGWGGRRRSAARRASRSIDHGWCCVVLRGPLQSHSQASKGAQNKQAQARQQAKRATQALYYGSPSLVAGSIPQ